MSVITTNEAALREQISGFSADTVRALSAARNEPAWMLERRLQAWQTFQALPWPKPTDEAWRRTRLTGFELDSFTPFAIPGPRQERAELDERLRYELDEMESSASLIFDSGALLYQEAQEDLASKGVIFQDLQTAVQEHPELIQKYFMTEAVLPDMNKFVALHAALWDTGVFVYVPRNVQVALPLQVIMRQPSGMTGGYHHTLIVAEEGAQVTVVDDLIGGEKGFQNGAVELILRDNSVVRYMNLQDFDHSVWNFLNGRAVMGRDTDLRWIQVSWGSRLTKAFLDLELLGE